MLAPVSSASEPLAVSAVSRRSVLAFGVAAFAAASVRPAAAAEPTIEQSRVKGVALSGYDAVSYFASEGPKPGKPEITAAHAGATWRFASVENRDAFVVEPARYVPQFGGYCAWAVSQGYTAPSDPLRYRIVDGKLYLNYDRLTHTRWALNVPSNIAKGEANWPAVLAK